MNNIMVDLETMGTRKTSVITTLAACQFDLDTGEIGKTFSRNIDMQSCADHGLTYDASTIKFWMGQPPETINKMFVDNVKLTIALWEFKKWLKSIRIELYPNKGWMTTEPEWKENQENFKEFPLKLWGNSASFDLGILETAYQITDVCDRPWSYREEFCYRTATNLFPELKHLVNIENNSDAHVALNDAVWQSKNLSAIYALMKGAKREN